MNDSPDTQGRTRSRPRVWVLAGLLALIPIVPIMIAVGVSSSSAKKETALASYQPLAQPPVALPKQPSPKPLAPGRGTLVALVRHPTQMHSAPGGHVIAHVGRKTSFGSPQALWVVRHNGKWIGVISPQAGNGHVGWIPTSAAAFLRLTGRSTSRSTTTR